MAGKCFRLVLTLSAFSSLLVHGLPEVRDLRGAPGFREVVLHWKYDRDVPSFLVYYCEIQAWGKYNCKDKVVEAEGNEVMHSATVKNLRMATTYSFTVSPYPSVDPGKLQKGKSLGRDPSSEITLSTKEFAAVGSRCLADACEIDIETGPHFGGRIGVESSDCGVRGEPASSRAIYTLRIEHGECGSRVRDEAVTSFVLVQETLPILTHSTKRFMVVCNYSMPDSFVVKAAVEMPQRGPVGRGTPQVIRIDDPDELGFAGSTAIDHGSNNNVIDSRLSVASDSWISSGLKQNENPKETRMAQLVLMLILVAAAVIGCAAAIWWFAQGARIQRNAGSMSPRADEEHLECDACERCGEEEEDNAANSARESQADLSQVDLSRVDFSRVDFGESAVTLAGAGCLLEADAESEA